GEDGLAEAVERLARATGYAVLAEATSGVRGRLAGAVTTYDSLLRDARAAEALRPEAVLRIGRGLTSKALQAWLDGSGAYTVLLVEDGAICDPQHAASLAVEGDATLVCARLAAELEAQGAPAGP